MVDSVEFVHYDKNGKVIKRYKSNTLWNRLLKKLHLKRKNCMVNVGFANMARLVLTDVGGTAYDYMAIGTIGAGTPAATDTEMELQQGVRMGGANCVGTRVTTGGITNNTAQWVATFSQALDATLTGVDSIDEVGIFYDAVGITVSMLLHIKFTAESMDWDAGDSIQMTVKCQMIQGS